MITPALKGGHEVTNPVYVEGAKIGDAIAIHIKAIEVTSMVTASGNDETVEGCFNGDPFVAAKCPEGGTLNPETVLNAMGEQTVNCKNCDTDIITLAFTHTYSIEFNIQQ